MILKEQDIYDNLESFRNKNSYSQSKMAELMGLSNKQAYSNMVKNKTMKMIYFVNLLNHSNLDVSRFFYSDHTYTDVSRKNNGPEEPSIITYSCQDCIKKEKTIQDLRETISLQNELLEYYRPKKEKGCG
ncbi:hypothetical protein [Draconibacterium orientale]|uniref:hypothetical protein n=1 Tax=Draconibacterium orientale TaxID=1168034 RepID=UPI0029C0FD68|nr:hypothetical protein [Draconibacterium orientale]